MCADWGGTFEEGPRPSDVPALVVFLLPPGPDFEMDCPGIRLRAGMNVDLRGLIRFGKLCLFTSKVVKTSFLASF